jgi:hypothetical protein
MQFTDTKVDLIHLQAARLLKYRNWATYTFRVAVASVCARQR